MEVKSGFRLGIFLLAAFWLLAGAAAADAQDAKAFVGDWNGAVFVSGAEIEIICHFQLDSEGNLSGTIDSPSQGAYGLSITSITVEGKKISFGVEDVPGEPWLKGMLDESGAKISGDFSQGESQGTFELSKQ